MYVDRTQLDYNIAKRNGLDAFQLVLTDWAQVSNAEPGGDTTTRIVLPSKSLSLYGCSINPSSDIASVVLSPTWTSLIGVAGDVKGVTNVPASPTVEVGKPVVQFSPGPIVFNATRRTLWNKTEANSWYWSAEDGIGVGYQIPLTGGDPSSTLILDCWIKPPGVRAIPVKRPDLYHYDQLNVIGGIDRTDRLVIARRIDGRKKVKFTVKTSAYRDWPAGPSPHGLAPQGDLDFRVSLLRPNNLGSGSGHDPVGLLTEIQVEPAIPGTLTTLAAGEQFDMEIDQPEATMLIMHVTIKATDRYLLNMVLQASD